MRSIFLSFCVCAILLSAPSAPVLGADENESRSLDSLTSAAAQTLYRASLDKLCNIVFTSRNAQMPFPSDCGPWPGMQVPTAAMLGLVLLGEGNTLIKGPHAATLRRLVGFVRQAGPAPHESIDNYRTWVLSFSLLFLSEVHRVAPSTELKRSLQDMVNQLEKAAYKTGGWGHTLEHERNTYGPFVAVSIWTVAALATAAEQGVTVNEKLLSQNKTWLRRSLGDSGGSFYATQTRSLVSPGRTAGVAWVLHHWDKTDSAKQIDRAAAFITRHAAYTPQGHASGMMNFGWGALAAGEVGGELAAAFWKQHTATLYKSRRPDGLFTPQPWRDLAFLDRRDTGPIAQQAKEPTADTTAGDAWASVWMLAAWQAARGKSLLCTKAKVGE